MLKAADFIEASGTSGMKLIENSLDAQTTSIQILAKDGGLKFLQIQDTGHGILKDDLPLVCERFATSKLRHFDDLMGVATYGFRGEALASISHVAHVTVTTKTRESGCAWRAQYVDGKLWDPKTNSPADPKPTAGNNGTQITIEDLFYNVETRRKALKNPSDEYNRILDIVNKYAIHNSKVAFTCKKVGSNTADVRTQQNATPLDNVRLVYGANVAKELLELKDQHDVLECAVAGLISNANFSVKKMTFILFINGRLVESAMLKKMLETLYVTYLPKNMHPFVYLSLEVKPSTIDVNVHPTKKEVLFLYEDQIVEFVRDSIKKKLAGANESRTFMAQVLHFIVFWGVSTSVKSRSVFRCSRYERRVVVSVTFEATPKKTAVNHLVRTDGRMQTLHPFLSKIMPELRETQTYVVDAEEGVDAEMIPANIVNSAENVEGQENVVAEEDVVMDDSLYTRPVLTDVRLTSVLELRTNCEEACHKGMTSLFKEHTFVGFVDHTSVLVQYQTKLFVVDIGEVTSDFFYQLYLKGFSNFGYIRLSTPLSLLELVEIALDMEIGDTPEIKDMDADKIAKKSIVENLMSRREMLMEYFSIDVDEDANLKSLPVLLKDHSPNLAKLPTFILRLGTEVKWDDEKDCFQTFGRELGLFYACESVTPMVFGAKGACEKASGDSDCGFTRAV
ncbi:hypothetical protein BC829DRAFT_425062 [Chytridium lagenaria]|nr:hypothetical protein BC829DRAFT_425062 [Chytridium lagenaria]